MDFKIIKKWFFLAFSMLFIGIFSGKAFLLHKKKRQLEITYEIIRKPIYVIALSDDKKVLQSAISQDYDNFKILHLTKGLVGDNLVENFQKFHFNERQSDRENILAVLDKLNPDDIVVIIDNQRWFAHTHALAKINQVYNQSTALALASKEVTYPSYELLDQEEDFAELSSFVVKAFSKDKIDNIVKMDDVLFLTTKGDK